MYEPGTILALKEPRDPDEETGEEFPYNEVEVIGRSPIAHTRKGDWEGEDAVGVIIVPKTNFGGTLDRAFGFLRTRYEVVSVPEVEVEQTAKVRIINAHSNQAGPTPEEVFRVEAPGVAPEPGQTRARTPLEDTGPETTNDPFGDDDQ